MWCKHFIFDHVLAYFDNIATNESINFDQIRKSVITNK